MKRLAAVLCLALAPMAMAKTRAVRSTPYHWTAPLCEQTGLPGLRFILPNGEVHGSTYDGDRTPAAMLLAAGAAPNTLWAVDGNGTISRSVNAGCTWSVVASVPEVLRDEHDAGIVARHAERVYFYNVARHLPRKSSVVRLTGGTVETFVIPDADGIIALDVDAADPLHLRAVGKYGIAWESTDGAATWTAVGDAVSFDVVVRAVAFDPRDFNHILAGTKTAGLRESRDGGRTWTSTTIATGEVEGIAFAPADSNVLYASTVPSTLLRSSDGGKTYGTVDVSQNPPWGRLYYMDDIFAVHPRDPFTTAAGGERGIGVKVISADGTRISWAYENVAKIVWAPSGVLYYLRLNIRTN